MASKFQSAGRQLDELVIHLGRRATNIDSPNVRVRPRTWTRTRTRNGDIENGPNEPVWSNLQNSITFTEETRRKQIHESPKMGTLSGVFVPVTLNIISILMFLRFGFILGQVGFLWTLGMLVISYFIDLMTTLSISAIATNGTVRGGGTYYMISRSLGPEFGGSIGIVFYLGQVLNAGMNVIGFVEALMANFGKSDGDTINVLPESNWWVLLYGTLLLLVCTAICLVGSKLFSKTSTALFVVLMVSVLSIPLSTIFLRPFVSRDHGGFLYTGPSWSTFSENMLPTFKKGAAGSERKDRETLQSIFGIFFPATVGIFAGASISGDLKNPGKSIPRGTLSGMLVTFLIYLSVIFSMVVSIPREALYTDTSILQDVNLSKYLIMAGVFSTSFFSALLGIYGSAKLLQAIARDSLLPGLSIFGQGTENDEPTLAVIITYILTQVTLLSDINQIASFVTMTYLLTFLCVNIACFLLKIGSAPNFRPRFHWFRWWTAAGGMASCFLTMYFVDSLYASIAIGVTGALFLVIHFIAPPKHWGDVGQSLIYHQVRKYLLRLDVRKDHVKFWRPQILLLVNDARRNWNLIMFCNALKKSALYMIGHIIVGEDFKEAVPELKRQQVSWLRLIDVAKVKAFTHITVSPSEVCGVRHLVMTAGLGGMRPNIVVLGFFNAGDWRKNQTSETLDHIVRELSQSDQSGLNKLPTDSCRSENPIGLCDWCEIVEDVLLTIGSNIAIAKGFHNLKLPKDGELNKRYIDLWPIQMSTEIQGGKSDSTPSLLTTNFDTYAMILQMGCILHMVPAWRNAFRLRVLVFVENTSDISDETQRVKGLLDNLRIPAELVVLSLANGDLQTYETIVNGKEDRSGRIKNVLREDPWRVEIEQLRTDSSGSKTIPNPASRCSTACTGIEMSRSTTRGSFDLAHVKGRRQVLLNMPHSLPMSMRVNVPHPAGFYEDDSSSSDESTYDILENSPLFAASLESGNASSNMLMAASNAVMFESPTDNLSALSQTPLGVSSHTLQNRPLSPDELRGIDVGKSPQPPPSFRSVVIPEVEIQNEGVEEGRPSIRFIGDVRPLRRPVSALVEERGNTLGFNDLPSKAQHLVVNELIRINSHDTAVVFTTLPSPSANTYRSTERSLEYVEGLEILCEELPPTLLIHSKNLTVTTSL
ncbi:Vacuolar cation-chloride cotransporter 1 [Neolecta irregularis DAH-3]|uniref:Vacuolar cation-chloride cotransporter 1 n=1 Tax=Neolecta irregularis (strain DAH-3) TaxID=1198029 RepID=A0A1U7LM86_NEOID|nr:Vacuolar cation-chloride cotransporter 1 [Neolecta irregularis DAH-3]|eukprot:OLL23780.1 Vacuolar cation-chloride cotransporter 1 [Neolecta irregularis DAH-3]